MRNLITERKAHKNEQSGTSYGRYFGCIVEREHDYIESNDQMVR